MATIDNAKMIADLIANDGHFEDDSQVYMIVEYINAFGKKTWGVTWTNEAMNRKTRYLEQSEYINNPKVIWHSENYK